MKEGANVVREVERLLSSDTLAAKELEGLTAFVKESRELNPRQRESLLRRISLRQYGSASTALKGQEGKRKRVIWSYDD